MKVFLRTGETDCHSQFENWLRKDRGFARTTVGSLIVRRGGALLPTVVPTDSRALSCPPIGALPRNRLASSATGGASPISPPAGDRKGRPYGGLQGVQRAGGQRRPPLRKCILRCVGEGLCPSRGRPQGSPLRKRNKRCNGRVVREADPYGRLQEVRGVYAG